MVDCLRVRQGITGGECRRCGCGTSGCHLCGWSAVCFGVGRC